MLPYCIIHRCLCFISYFFCSLLSVSKKWNRETVLPFLYSYNWQKFRNHKMNEKRSQEYQSMDPESVTGQINSRILELLLRRFCCLIFALSRKILIWFSLIKRFTNDYKRYSSHLQMSILHWVAPIKVFLSWLNVFS